MSDEDAEEFVTDPVDVTNKDEMEAIYEEASDGNERQEDAHNLEAPQSNNWRNSKRGWDDEKCMDDLLKKLSASS